MSLAAGMNRYDTCIACGAPVTLGLPCEVCASGKAKMPAISLELATIAERDMWRDKAQRAESALAKERAHSERLAAALAGEVAQRDRKLPMVTGTESASQYQAIVVDMSVARAESDAAIAAHEARKGGV